VKIQEIRADGKLSLVPVDGSGEGSDGAGDGDAG
jgi:hypothetical protein